MSIPSNIAEGQERNSRKEFRQFIAVAQGSKGELSTQLQICIQVGYLPETETLKASAYIGEIGAMLQSLSLQLKTEN